MMERDESLNRGDVERRAEKLIEKMWDIMRWGRRRKLGIKVVEEEDSSWRKRTLKWVESIWEDCCRNGGMG